MGAISKERKKSFIDFLKFKKKKKDPEWWSDRLTSKILIDAIKASFPDLENTLKSELKYPDKNVERFFWCAINYEIIKGGETAVITYAPE